MHALHESGPYENVVGMVKKVREKNGSLASSVGLSVDERYLVLASNFLHCFRKEPVGSFVFQQNTISLCSADGKVSSNKSNNLQPYASVQLGASLSFCRAYDASGECRVFELQDDRVDNADRVYAFEAADADEMRDRWLGPIDKRHQDILRQARSEKLQRRAEGTPEYVKIFDSDGKRGQQACREFFRSMLEQCYPEIAVAEAGKRLWGQHLGGAGEILEFLEQIAFETTVAPVEVAAESSDDFSGGSSRPAAAQTEKPLGRTDVLALAFDESNRMLVSRFRLLLFDADTVSKLEQYDIHHDGTCSNSNQGSNSEKAAYLSTLPLSSEIVTNTGLAELHTLVAFIIRYQNRLRALQSTTAASVGPNGKAVSLPTHCEVFDYLPCVYERYINGIISGDSTAVKQKAAATAPAPATSGTVPRRNSITRRSAPAPPPTTATGTGVAAGDIASSDGAASQLQEHCAKVWTGIRVDPADAIARHIDGTFYTEGPTAVWGCLHQHLKLGSETNATILRVMIAEKIALALSTLFQRMGVFVTLPSSSSDAAKRRADADVEPTLSDVVATDAAVREVEVEFLCAITNDCGIHLDEVLTVVGGFGAIEGVKRHVDGAFDAVSTALMCCATTALRRLARLVLADVETPFSQVFTHDWLPPLAKKQQGLPDGAVSTIGYDEMLSKAMKEGAAAVDAKPAEEKVEEDTAAEHGVQVHTILHTLGDYLEDFRVYLVQFWYDKFAAMLFTQAVNRYIDVVISRISEHIASSGTINRLGSLMSSSSAPAVPLCTVDARTIAKIRSDMTALQQYISRFNRRTSSQGGVNPTKYTELLQFFTLVLECDAAAPDFKTTEVGKAIAAAAQTAPFALTQLKQFLTAALNCRPDIKSKDQEVLLGLVKASDKTPPSDAALARDRMQRQQQLEQAVGLVLALNNFAGTSIHVVVEEGADATKGQGLLTSSLSALRSLVSGNKGNAALRRNSGGGALVQASAEAAAANESAAEARGLSDDVQRLIREHEATQLAEIQAAEKAEADATAALDAGFLHCTGTLDKRAEGTALWQKRFLRLQSRRVEAPGGGAAVRLAHALLWYKRQEGISLGSAELADMTSFMVTQFARPLEYMPASDCVRLVGGPGPEGLLVSRWRPDASDSEIDERSNEDSGFFVMRVIMRGRGQSFDLRAKEVDMFVRWINTLAAGAGLSYDEGMCEWSRSGRENLPAAVAAWRKLGVLAQKEETAMSVIQMAKAQQRKEKAEREKLQQNKPGSAAALIAETKLAHSSNNETMNPLLSPKTQKPAPIPEAAEVSESSNSAVPPPAPPPLPPRKSLSVSTSVDSFQVVPPSPIMSPNSGGKKLSLMLPTAITTPVVVEEDSPVKLAPKSGTKSSSTTNLPAAAAGGSAKVPHSYSASLKGEPVRIETASPRRRLSSADMPVPRRSSLKTTGKQPVAFQASSPQSSIEESDEESERGSSRSSRGSSFSSTSDIEMMSRASTDSLGSVGSVGSRRKSVSFTASEVREYEPRAPPEETLNSPSRQEPQRYQLESVKHLPPSYKGRKLSLATPGDDAYDSNGRRRHKQEDDGCCACM